MMKYYSLTALLIVASQLIGCGPPSEERFQRLFGDDRPALHTYAADGREVSYAETGRGGNEPIIFIHGTPGSWSAFAVYLADPDLAGRFNLISVDRPGFGTSGYGELQTSLAAQAAALAPLLERKTGTCGAILVGHSLGGPIAARAAMDYPDMVAALVLIAPSLDPELESPRWYNRVASYRAVQWLLPNQLVLANREVMVLPDELRLMMPRWAELDMPVTVIQGGRDRLVDPKNANFAERVITAPLKMVRDDEAGHFVLWKQPELIKREILDLAARLGTGEQCRRG